MELGTSGDGNVVTSAKCRSWLAPKGHQDESGGNAGEVASTPRHCSGACALWVCGDRGGSWSCSRRHTVICIIIIISSSSIQPSLLGRLDCYHLFLIKRCKSTPLPDVTPDRETKQTHTQSDRSMDRGAGVVSTEPIDRHLSLSFSLSLSLPLSFLCHNSRLLPKPPLRTRKKKAFPRRASSYPIMITIPSLSSPHPASPPSAPVPSKQPVDSKPDRRGQPHILCARSFEADVLFVSCCTAMLACLLAASVQWPADLIAHPPLQSLAF